MASWPPYPQPPVPPPPPPVPYPDRPWRPTVLGLRSRQWMVVAVALGLCYTVLAGGAFAAAWATLHRAPTDAELRLAASAEVARRWRTWPAGRIFPQQVAYTFGDDRTERATRLGVLPDTSCDGAADEAIAAALRKQDCRGALRATYTDGLQGVVVTVGVIAFPDAWKADAALRAMPPNSDPDEPRPADPALHAVAFAGTASARFTDAARQHRTALRYGPYLVLTAAGQSDGRPAAAITKARPGDAFGPARQLAERIALPLGARPTPDCAEKKEWRC
ncbi:hypothetical protein [Actinomadura parmotrematis]|uniref:Uncharacterized protein n=1 Tax=Actinomadura parmotrematis TaxID=2864039 RepID=A0ABS7FLP2_9ACTN|nr:hypothetical protein [Actinomadura parmotrematis]MBW8481292.1 hypothetical protein [Actinomadura parmotrematis]